MVAVCRNHHRWKHSHEDGRLIVKVKINYLDGTSEIIDNVFDLIDHGDNEFSYFLGAGFTRYHAMEVESVEEIEEVQS